MDNLTIAIPFYNGHQYIHRLMDSLPAGIPICFVDDQSDTPLHLDTIYHPEKPTSIIIAAKKQYFSGSVNLVIEACETDVLILNQDVWFEDKRWVYLIEQYRTRYAMIGERIKGNHPAFGELGYSHGTFLYLRRDAIDAVGLLDTELYPLWGATAEWQWRAARKGFEVLPLKEIPGFHHERPEGERFGSSIKTLLEKEPRNQDLLVRTPPLLSVIVPCHNYAKYLEDCINSLIGGPTSLGEMPGQTLQSFEIIIVDDASTDHTPEVVKKVAKVEKGIRAYRLEKNVGTARALNYGIQRAVGKYITFLSADDMREPDSLKNLVRICEENPHSFAYDDCWLFYKHERIKKWTLEDYDFETLLHRNQVHAGIVFPRVAWEEVGGYPAIMDDGREDWAFNVALGIKGWCGIHVKQFGYLYRREGQNRSLTNTTPEHREVFLNKIRSLFPEIYGGHRPMACCGKGGSNTPNIGARSGMRTPQSTMMAMANAEGARMANIVGSQGMVKVQYLGKQMTSTWHGDTTNTPYRFGEDKQYGWVDKRDAGERGKSGFLNKKDRNQNWVFKTVSEKKADPVEEPVVAVNRQAPTEEMVAVVEGQTVGLPEPVSEARGVAEVRGTLSVVEKLDFPNPSAYNVEQIKLMVLTREQWEALYRAELADRSRKGLKDYLEEKLANWAR